MIKWATNWAEAKNFRGIMGASGATLVWAIEMPPNYPECRVTRRGIANIAVTTDAALASELQEDGGYVQVLP
ncbi:MAG: hypothetical protein FOGNACKC_04280 [Anaerolineae bacterium]|nr:hypothetical protein [Anaerolineae bacterium]